MRPAFVVLIAVPAAAWVGCRGETGEAGEAAGAEPSAEDFRSGEHDPDDYQSTRIVDLGEGSHAVFGLRIPRGMRPAAGPHKVYRFEGTWDPVAARRFLMRQVETGKLLEEPSGYLIREARVLAPAGEADPGLRLAIRVFRGRMGGATVDVWVERDPERERARAAGGSPGSGAVPLGPGHPEVRRRAEQRRRTFEIVEKLSRGEAPSAEDADHPFFQ